MRNYETDATPKRHKISVVNRFLSIICASNAKFLVLFEHLFEKVTLCLLFFFAECKRVNLKFTFNPVTSNPCITLLNSNVLIFIPDVIQPLFIKISPQLLQRKPLLRLRFADYPELLAAPGGLQSDTRSTNRAPSESNPIV